MSRINVRRLKTFTIISPFLHMSDGRTKQGRPILLRHRKQCYLTIKLDKFFNNQFFYITTTTIAAIFPGMFQFIRTLHKRLPLARRRHQRLHYARKTDLFRSSFQLIQSFCIKIFSSFQSQLLCGQITDSLAVHGKVYGTGTRYHLNTFLLKIVKAFCTDGLDFRNNDIRLVFAYYTFQCIAVKHAKYLIFISHLHGRCSGI